MGVDVVLKARLHEPPMDADAFDELQMAFRERWPCDPIWDKPGDPRYPDLGFDEYEPVQTIEVKTLDRYYGVGYERGPWPEIREMGDWLALALGETAEVRYGGDTADEWEFLTAWPEVRKENDAHYEAVGHEPYRAIFRRFERGN